MDSINIGWVFSTVVKSSIKWQRQFAYSCCGYSLCHIIKQTWVECFSGSRYLGGLRSREGALFCTHLHHTTIKPLEGMLQPQGGRKLIALSPQMASVAKNQNPYLCFKMHLNAFCSSSIHLDIIFCGGLRVSILEFGSCYRSAHRG